MGISYAPYNTIFTRVLLGISILDGWVNQYYNKVLNVAKLGEKEFYFNILCIDLINTRPNEFNCSVMNDYQAWHESINSSK